MNTFKFSSFISSADFAFHLRDLFPSWPLAAHHRYLGSPTPTSRGSNWTPLSVSPGPPGVIWVFIKSIPVHHSQKPKTSVTSGFLLYSPTTFTRPPLPLKSAFTSVSQIHPLFAFLPAQKVSHHGFWNLWAGAVKRALQQGLPSPSVVFFSFSLLFVMLILRTFEGRIY